MGFFGKVNEGFRIVRSLHLFEILNNFLEKIRKGFHDAMIINIPLTEEVRLVVQFQASHDP